MLPCLELPLQKKLFVLMGTGTPVPSGTQSPPALLL